MAVEYNGKKMAMRVITSDSGSSFVITASDITSSTESGTTTYSITNDCLTRFKAFCSTITGKTISNVKITIE